VRAAPLGEEYNTFVNYNLDEVQVLN
jgi:hypothetical protein